MLNTVVIFKGLIFVTSLNIKMTGMGHEIFVSLNYTVFFSEHFPFNKYLGSFSAGRYAGLGVMCHFYVAI
jgi:hypothetical protein